MKTKVLIVFALKTAFEMFGHFASRVYSGVILGVTLLQATFRKEKAADQ